MPDERSAVEDRSVLTRPTPAPDRTWAYGPLPEQVADVYLPSGPPRRPVVLVHGGFWRPEYDRMHLRPLARALADRGHPVASLEYRRTPARPDDTVADLDAALARIGEAVGPHRPVLVGHSAGGHLVLLLASRHDADAVALAPVADLVAADALRLDGGAVADFLGSPAHERADLDPVRGARPRGRVAVVHGAADAIVPPSLSRAYRDAHGAAVVLVDLPGVGHFAVIDPDSAAWADVQAAIDAIDGAPGIE